MTYRFYTDTTCVLHHFGHGLSVTPVNVTRVTITSLNDGYRVELTGSRRLPVLVFADIDAEADKLPRRMLVAYSSSNTIDVAGEALHVTYSNLTIGPLPKSKTQLCVLYDSHDNELCLPFTPMREKLRH